MLREDDLNRLKAFCKDFIPGRVREGISQGVDLFNALEERNRLSQNNLNFLFEALNSCCGGRSDVMDLLTEYRSNQETYLCNSNTSGGN